MKLENFFPHRLAIAAEGVSRVLFDVYGREHGLSREEWRLLALLADAVEMTSRDLKARAALDKVQISRASKRLEEKGLIDGRTAEEDRRLRVYACTREGRALFESVFPKVETCSDAILRELSGPDRQALLQGLDALNRALRQGARRNRDVA